MIILKEIISGTVAPEVALYPYFSTACHLDSKLDRGPIRLSPFEYITTFLEYHKYFALSTNSYSVLPVN